MAANCGCGIRDQIAACYSQARVLFEKFYVFFAFFINACLKVCPDMFGKILYYSRESFSFFWQPDTGSC
jgi:hypothetical protein